MRCSLCEKVSDQLYPMNHCIGKVCTIIYVCKDCATKNKNKNADNKTE